MTIRLPRRRLLTAAAAAGGLGAGAMLPGIAAAEAEPGHGTLRHSPYRVTMVIWRGWTDTDQGFQDYFERRRIPVDLTVRDIDRQVETFPAVVNEIRRDRPDLVYLWGTSVALGVLGRYDELYRAPFLDTVPAVFCNVSRPVDSRITADLGPSGRNFTGSTYIVPMAAQLSTIRSYRPFRRLACMYNPLEENAVLTARELETEGRAQGFEVVTEALPTGSGQEPIDKGVGQLVEKFKHQGAELLYVPPDSYLSRRRRDLTSAALAFRLPTFTAAEGTFQDSFALMGLINPYYVIGQLTAWIGEQIMVNGKDPGSMPIEELSRYNLCINLQTALGLDLPPPMLMMRVASIS